jgi:hypothetical protein
MACRRFLSSARLKLIGTEPVVAYGNETCYTLYTKLQIRHLHLEFDLASVLAVASCRVAP